MRKVTTLLVLLLIFLGAYFLKEKKLYFKESPPISLRFSQRSFEISKINPSIPAPSEVLPPPLRVTQGKKGFLTKQGIVEWTNSERKNYGLLPLKVNPLLEKSAQLKLDDMFAHQYFAHVSPSGVELKDWINKVGYDFILIGENLAMGNFENDRDLVLAWMESPGHRENILNPKYQEIGVAVKEGLFEGKRIWIAVQHFGKSLSACPQPDELLRKRIEERQQQIKDLEDELLLLQKEIRKNFPKWGIDQEKITIYNSLVQKYNSLVEEIENLITKYNSQVKIFNECVNE